MVVVHFKENIKIKMKMNTSAKTGLLIESGFVFEIHWGVSPLYMMLVKH